MSAEFEKWWQREYGDESGAPKADFREAFMAGRKARQEQDAEIVAEVLDGNLGKCASNAAGQALSQEIIEAIRARKSKYVKSCCNR